MPLNRLRPPRRSPDPSWASTSVPRPVPKILDCSPTHTGPPRGYPDPSRTSPRVLQPFPDFLEGSLTCPGPPRGFPPPVLDLLEGPSIHVRPPRESLDPSRTYPEFQRLVPDLPKCPPTRLKPPRGSLDPSQTTPSVSRPVPHLPEGPPTRLEPPRGPLDPSLTSPIVPHPSRTSPRSLDSCWSSTWGSRPVTDLPEGPPPRPGPPRLSPDPSQKFQRVH